MSKNIPIFTFCKICNLKCDGRNYHRVTGSPLNNVPSEAGVKVADATRRLNLIPQIVLPLSWCISRGDSPQFVLCACVLEQYLGIFYIPPDQTLSQEFFSYHFHIFPGFLLLLPPRRSVERDSMKKRKSCNAIFEVSLLSHFKTKTKPNQRTWRSQATFSLTCLWLSLLFRRSCSYLSLSTQQTALLWEFSPYHF